MLLLIAQCGKIMKSKQSSLVVWGLVLSSLALIISGLGYFKFKQVSAAIEMAQSFPEHYEVVSATSVQLADHTPTVSVLGTAISPLQSDLYFELAGKVAFVGLQAGEKAKSGELIFQLDIKEELARIKSAEARKKHAASVLQRYKTLLGKKSISQELYDQAYSDLVVIQSEIDVLQTTINKKTVKAPFTGEIGIHNIKKGDYVTANQVLSLFTGDSAETWVDFSVPQFYREVPLGASVQVRNIDGLSSSPFKLAKVIAKDTQISDETRSLMYRSEIETSLANFKHNMPLEVKVPIAQTSVVFQVPVTSINQDSYGSYVMKLNPIELEPEKFRAQRIAVNTISEVDGSKLITGDIKEGDIWAAAGSFKLYEGILVHARQAQPTENYPLVAASGE